MKSKKKIKARVKELKKSIKEHKDHAKIHKGDGYDRTRERGILAREGYVSALRWVLK